MYAFFSALLAGCVVLAFGLTETVTTWWVLVIIGLGSWLVLYFVLKVLASLANGGSVGDGLSDGIGDIGGGFGGDGASCGSGGCGSGGGD